MSKKVVAVLGASGAQGGSVVEALLKKPEYTIRAITRNVDSPAAQALKEQGVEVVSASLTDKDSLIKAFDEAHAVFGVTIPFTEVSEEQQGRNIVDAAKAAKVPLLVWSSLPSPTDLSNGKYNGIIHFEQKASVDKYIATTDQPTVIVHTGSFAENILRLQQLQRDPSDPDKWNIVYPFLRPDARMPGIWVEADLGNIVAAIIDHWEDEKYRTRLTKEPVIAAPYTFSPQEIVDTLRKVTGKAVSLIINTDVSDYEKHTYSAVNEGYYRYPPQTLLEEFGVKTHNLEDYAREKLLPYIQSAQ